MSPSESERGVRVPGEPQAGESVRPPQGVRLYRSEELFAGERLVCIEHAGAVYRLQITVRGKLILQK